MTMFLVGLKRFAKGFVAGGLAQVSLIISSGVSFHNLTDAKALGAVLLTAFVTGGVLMVEKMVNYTPPTIPTDVSNGIMPK